MSPLMKKWWECCTLQFPACLELVFVLFVPKSGRPSKNPFHSFPTVLFSAISFSQIWWILINYLILVHLFPISDILLLRLHRAYISFFFFFWCFFYVSASPFWGQRPCFIFFWCCFSQSRCSRIVTLVNSLVVQWLRLCVFSARGPGSIPGWGTKTSQVTQCG